MALAPDKTIGQYLLARRDNRDGLPQNTVSSIVQGPRGYSHAQSMRLAVLDLKLANPDSPSHECLSISVGVACSEVTGQGTPAALLRAADQALYDAKASGRNRVAGWRASLAYA